jgi:hypothetical protein
MENYVNLGYIRCDRLEIGDCLIPAPMALNKRTWKVVEIEPVGSRLFIKVEIMDDSFSKVDCPELENETPGQVIRIDSTPDNKFPVRRSSR